MNGHHFPPKGQGTRFRSRPSLLFSAASGGRDTLRDQRALQSGEPALSPDHLLTLHSGHPGGVVFYIFESNWPSCSYPTFLKEDTKSALVLKLLHGVHSSEAAFIQTPQILFPTQVRGVAVIG